MPTAILLSKFTNNYPALLVSVNVASLGIIFSSLSGIIALKEFIKVSNKEKFGKKAEPVYKRVLAFMKQLLNNRLIKLKKPKRKKKTKKKK